MAALTGIASVVALLPLTSFLTALACDTNGVEFGYFGSLGPKHWGRLNPNFTRCAKGMTQSPIDIRTDELVYNPSLGRLHRDYEAANASTFTGSARSWFFLAPRFLPSSSSTEPV